MSQSNNSSNKRRTRMDAGHSNIHQKKLAEYRRDQVFRLSSMGYSQPKIASVLNVSQSLISLDISLLRQRAREALADYLENKLPLIFQESMTGISDVISQTWEIINNSNISHHDKLHALSLVADCNERRLDMASNGSIVEDGIRFVQEARQHLVEIAPESAKQMLHEEEQNTSAAIQDNNNSSNSNSSDNKREQLSNKKQPKNSIF
jgi:predicted transcriptional regulator